MHTVSYPEDHRGAPPPSAHHCHEWYMHVETGKESGQSALCFCCYCDAFL